MDLFSIPHLLLLLVVVLLVFGTKKLPSIGKDLAGAVRGFKEGMKTEDEKAKTETAKTEADKPAKDAAMDKG